MGLETLRRNPKVAVLLIPVVGLAAVAGVLAYQTISGEFTISLDPASITVERGAQQSVQIRLKSTFTFSGDIFLTVLNVPPNITASIGDPTVHLAPSREATSNVSLAVSQHTYSQDYAVAVSAASGSARHQANLALKVVGTTLSFYMIGALASGWSPNSINVTQGDTIQLSLTSKDSLLHAFYVDYDGNLMPSAAEPLSPDFSSPSIPEPFSFTISQIGTFTYYCKYHPSMTGNLRSTAP